MSASASELPDCLKEGALALEIFEMARDEAFYGDAANPIIAACAERNKTYSDQWTCFENAVSSAAETRELIGLENIADACVAGVSDPGLAQRIKEAYRQSRAKRFPDEMFYGGGIFYPFQGCPEPDGQAGSPPDAAGGVTGEVAGGSPDDAGRDIYSAEACSAYREIETMIRTTNADRIRLIAADLKSLEDPDTGEIATATGLPSDSATFFLGAGESQATATGMLVGAFIETIHPTLLDEFLSQNGARAADPATALGGEMAKGFLSSILAEARRGYEEGCVAD